MNRNRWLVYGSSVLAALSLVGVALAAGAGPRRDFTEVPGVPTQNEYILVRFQDPPAASYEGGIPGLERTRPERGRFDPTSPAAQAYLRHLDEQHAAYRSWLASNAPRAEVVRELRIVFNGMAIKLNGVRPERAGGGPGASAWAFSTLYRPTMNVSTELVGADVLWAGSPATAGEGVDVAIIDTGIHADHPFFACKTIDHHGPYASGVAPGATNPFPVIVFDHGTHVAGTVGGCVSDLATIDPDGPITGTISGVAPGATLHDFNVFPGFGAGFVAFDGSAFSQDIAAAIEDAVLEGIDVVNLSIGGSVQGPHDFLAEAVDSAVDAGLVVAVAAGNSGPGDSTVESPGSAAGALTAGASTNPHFIGIDVIVGGSTFGAALGDFANFGDTDDDGIGESPVTADYTVTTPANGCSTISTDLTGRIALIDRGVCSFTTKIRNAAAAGAVGVLVVNNVAGDPSAMGHDGTEPFPTIPAAMLSKADGNSIKPSGSVTVDGTELSERLTANADIIAGFSSRGPSPFTFLVKPDVTAPGVNVYSSVFSFGPGGFEDVVFDFAMFQGTSMATPHLAGGAALLLDLHPDWSPADVKSAMVQNGARVVTDHVNGTADPGVLARGGGRLELVGADGTPLTFDPASASFGYWSGNVPVSGTLALNVRNVSGSSQSCTVAVTGPAIVTAAPGSLSLAAGAETTLSLMLEAGRSDQTPSGDYSGDVEIDCGGTVLRVPWWVRVSRQGRP
jgi:minor extracellular serine protease Vpr